MAQIEGCNFPEEGFLYDVEDQMWVRFDDDGSITAGLTDVGQHIAGSILYLRPRKVGEEVRRGKRVAIIESGKYVGPINAPLSGRIIELNDAALADPRLVNDTPYGEGWVLRIKPSRLEEERGLLKEGEAAMAALREKMEMESWSCR
ncbi:MAG: glycine cleavage system protein H [Thermoleophilia bacterium]